MPKSVSLVAVDRPKKQKNVTKKNPLFGEFGIREKAGLDILSSHGVYPLLDLEDEDDSIEHVLQNASISEAEYIRHVEADVKNYETTRVLANTLLTCWYAKYIFRRYP